MIGPLSKILLGQGDALALPLPDNCVHAVVTSPPYWALRDYGVGTLAGELGSEARPDCWRWTGVDTDGRPGREPVAGCCHVCNLRLVMAEIWRVLHPSGSVWFNYGHMYTQEAPRGRYGDQGDLSTGDHGELGPRRDLANLRKLGLKKGDHVLMAERLALAFQLDGWYVRSRIIWHKPNPMPGPAQTWRRPIDAHELVWLLVKDWRYYYDAEAIRERQTWTGGAGNRNYRAWSKRGREAEGQNNRPNPGGRHKRDVWTIPTKPYPGAHFACFPPDLVEPCILAGTSEAGVCPECGWPWKRITLDWAPGCECDRDPVPALVLDPFVGSGTTCAVARELGRLSVGLDISFDYLTNEARDRLGAAAWDEFYNGRAAADDDLAELPLFANMESH